MSKNDLIDEIIRLNRSAKLEFLQQFDERDLRAYVEQLRSVMAPSPPHLCPTKPTAA